MASFRMIRKGIRYPHRVPGYLLGKVFPESRFGGNVIEREDFVSFKLGGFASAPSRPLLLARHNYELLYIQDFLRGREFERSLEIGCGFGRFSPIIARFAESNNAVDVNEKAIRMAETHHEDIEFGVHDAVNLGFINDQFDLVTTWTVLQHVPPQRIETAVEEIVRVLSSDGVLLMCEATRYPEDDGGHTWDRTVAEYEDLVSPLKLRRDSYIDEIDTMSDMETPGRVMLFEP